MKEDPAAEVERREHRPAEPSGLILPNGSQAAIAGSGEYHNAWAREVWKLWQESQESA